jgi:hypothetical protein
LLQEDLLLRILRLCRPELRRSGPELLRRPGCSDLRCPGCPDLRCRPDLRCCADLLCSDLRLLLPSPSPLLPQVLLP